MKSQPLDDYLEIHLGFKTLLNDFFYVDTERIERFGIEQEFLEPIFKLSDLDGDRYYQDRLKQRRWLFWCELSPSDLRGTGAWKYISWGSKQETRPRKQTHQPVLWPKAPALPSSRRWYLPAQKLNKTRVALRKAPGQKYAPFLFSEPVLLDQRLYTVLPRDGIDCDVASAYLSSSLFPLALETNANLSLGSGYLTLGTNALRRLPTIDLRLLSSSRCRQNIIEAANRLWAGRVVEAADHRSNALVRELDEAILVCLGLPPSLAADIGREVAHFAKTRLDLQSLRVAAPHESTSADIEDVVSGLIPELQGWLETRRFPDDYVTMSYGQMVSFPRGPLGVQVERMMETATVRVRDESDQVVFEDQMPLAIAEVLLRALQFGRRNFILPADSAVAAIALSQGHQLAEELAARLEQVMSRTSLGGKYEGQVRARLLSRLSVDLDGLLEPANKRVWDVPGF